MTCPNITQSLYIKENVMRIMEDTSLGLYFQGQTQIPIVSLKVLRLVWIKEHKS